jgi:hypothetical protein
MILDSSVVSVTDVDVLWGIIVTLELSKLSGLITNWATSTYSYFGVNVGLVYSDGLLCM